MIRIRINCFLSDYFKFRALRFIHSHGVVHRDVSAMNIASDGTKVYLKGLFDEKKPLYFQCG